MKKEDQSQACDDLLQDMDRFWEDPRKIMVLIDLLFLWEDPDGRKTCS